MIDNGPDGFMLIGLHKLAAQNGDGLVPELYELLMRRAEEQRRAANVTSFPSWKARLPGEMPDHPLDEMTHDAQMSLPLRRAWIKLCRVARRSDCRTRSPCISP
ncbi:hypothetical protein [Rhizobium sp. P44RR-XXIV]|uniref:hypothetical protein n=1 Tax=Rhizobium sp. P44RR-XXIV TaxID=1921145 RepID=UPI001FEE25D0|nr:hypothetical protein [Rhizobium sp. P44RR-XXIV]